MSLASLAFSILHKSSILTKRTAQSQLFFSVCLMELFWAQEDEDDPFESLARNIPGTAGDDYPIFAQVPPTLFQCSGLTPGGYYADPETDCQAFHICVDHNRLEELVKYSFLCPNGTIFNQEYFICDWWFNVDCAQAESYYSLNELNYAEAIEAVKNRGQF